MLKAQIVSYVRGVRVIGTVSYSEKTGVSIETQLDGLRDELMSGELAGRAGNVFSIHDGAAFVRELPFIYSGSYVRAKIVSDE